MDERAKTLIGMRAIVSTDDGTVAGRIELLDPWGVTLAPEDPVLDGELDERVLITVPWGDVRRIWSTTDEGVREGDLIKYRG